MNERTILRIEGMSCPSCVEHVSGALSGHGGIAKVNVDLREGVAVIEHDPRSAPVAHLIESLDAAGYPATEQRHELACCAR
jgi:copper chaperone